MEAVFLGLYSICMLIVRFDELFLFDIPHEAQIILRRFLFGRDEMFYFHARLEHI